MVKAMLRELLTIIILLIILTIILAVDGVTLNIEDSDDIEAKVDEYVEPYMDVRVFSGSILMYRAGEIVLNKGYGMANYEFDVPNTPKTKFHIASISKTFTAVGIMVLQEKGQLNTNDSLSKFIPDYPKGDTITIHQLLTHTSGIPNVNVFPDYDKQSKFHHTAEDLIKMFKDKPLNFNPGERYEYSNSNYNLLAYIIEKVSGMDYGTFLKKNIFDPLDMNDTGHDGYAGLIIKNRAAGYQPAGSIGIENAPYLDWSIKTGNGSIYSTVEDLFKWDRALYTEKIVKKSTLKKIFTEHIKGVGYAWFIRKRNNRNVTDYNGRSPGFTSYLRRFIDDDACIIILSNNYSVAAQLMMDDLGAILFGEEYQVPLELKAVQMDKEILEAYEGRYQFGDDFYVPETIVQVAVRENYLYMHWAGTAISSLLPLSETQFLDRFYWAKINFVKNEKGEITGFIWHDSKDYSAVKLKNK